MNIQSVLKLFWIVLILPGLAACSNTSKTVTYHEQNFESMKNQTGITVKMIDGRIFHYYKAEVIKFTEQDIWLKTWAGKNSEPAEVVFRRSDIVIENRQYSQSGAVSYLISMAVLIGLIALLNRWLY